MLLLVVLGLLVTLRWRPLINLDTAATAAGYRVALTTGWLRATAQSITALGSPGTVDGIAAVVVLAMVWARRWSAALAMAAARLGELGIEFVVKAVLDRPRPVFTPPLATAPGASFPSGHAAGATAVYLTLLLLVMPAVAHRRRGLIVGATLLLVAMIAASRVVLGVHYPSDVLGGLALGFGCAAAAILLTRSPALRPRSRRGAAGARLRREAGQRPDTWAS